MSRTIVNLLTAVHFAEKYLPKSTLPTYEEGEYPEATPVR